MTERIGTFHQLTQEAKSTMSEASAMLDYLIHEQRKQQPNPQRMAFLTLRCLEEIANAAESVTTAAMHWAADRIAEGGK